MQTSWHGFDICYEKTSGEALLVYGIASASNFRVGYRTWSISSGWSSEQIYVISGSVTGNAYMIRSAMKPTASADEIAVIVMGDATSLDDYALSWNGD